MQCRQHTPFVLHHGNMSRKNYEIAREMHLDGRSAQQIAEALDVPESTVRGWKSRHGWDTAGNINGMLQTLERRIDELSRADPTSDNLRAMRAYGIEYRQYMLMHAKLRAYEPSAGGKRTSDKDFNPRLANRGRKSNADKNYLDAEAVAKLAAAHHARLYPHQRVWDDAINSKLGVNPFTGKPSGILNLNKSRQIGATDWKGHHSIVKAVQQGINQNFLSASRSQALLFRGYIQKFVYEHTGVELKGGGDASPMTIRTDDHAAVDLRFLSASSNSAQGPHGDTISDEYLWQRDFDRLRRVSSAMATQIFYNQCYISTPSVINHPGYAWWSGEYGNKGKPVKDQLTLDISHANLMHGRHCEDGQWRQIVTLDDAVSLGFDRVDPDLLRIEYSPEEFRNLFMCEFIDDSASVFGFDMIQRCMVDTLEIDEHGHRVRWVDFDPELRQPFGRKEVWLGFDPSRTRDNSALVIVAPPDADYQKFRILEKATFHNLTFEYQALRIKDFTERYNVKRIAIDTTGMGQGVYEKTKELVSGSRIVAINYSSESKTELVTRGIDIFQNRRIELDSGWTDLGKALMTIYRTATDNGTLTFKARRTNTTGHADLAFALLHALSFEPLTGRRKRGRVA